MATARSNRDPPAPFEFRMTTRTQGKKVCKRCQRIDLDKVLQTKSLTRAGNPVRALGSIAKWKTNSCPLCELMFKAAGNPQNGQNLVLRRSSTRRIPEWGWQSIDLIALSVGSAFLVPQPRGVDNIRMIGPHLSIEVVKGWISVCSEWHKDSCGSRKFPSPGASMMSFKLIDSHTRRIISRTDSQDMDHPYLALSYLWGQSTEKSKFLTALPSTLPRTIEDALEVTKQLGYRYIWIDRFCINQESDEEKREQFPNMDLIYSSAQLTIIAAAGDGPDHGLPGITPRTPNQPLGRIGKHFLISAMSDPRPHILESKWNTRGWTYQEGLLSRRRLIFTEQQTYYECRSMYCCEALNFALADLHTRDHKRFKASLCNGSSVGIFPRSFGGTAWEVVERIEEYSKKTLSHPTDILNALLGVLKALESGPRNIRHCLGIPILPSPPNPRTKKDDVPNAKTVVDHHWSPIAGFCTGLCWDVDKPVARREGFPSWSWVGWMSNISWGFSKWEWHVNHGNTDLRVQFQLHDGRVVTWSELEVAYETLMPQVSGTLQISGWTTPLRIYAINSSRLGVNAEVAGTDGQRFSWSFKATTTNSALFASEPLEVHLTRDFRLPGDVSKILVMVVCKTRSGIFERTGFGKFSATNLIDRDANYGEYGPPLLDMQSLCPSITMSFREIYLC